MLGGQAPCLVLGECRAGLRAAAGSPAPSRDHTGLSVAGRSARQDSLCRWSLAMFLGWLNAGTAGLQSPSGSRRWGLVSTRSSLPKAGPGSLVSPQKLPTTGSLPGSALRPGGQSRCPGSPPTHHVLTACGAAQTAPGRPAGLVVRRGRHCYPHAPARSPESITAPATLAPPIPLSTRRPGRGALGLDPPASWLEDEGSGGQRAL